MNVLSLFDGISCGRVALERAGIKVNKYYASEIDKYAIQIAQKNYPDTIQLGDVKGIKGTDFIDWDSENKKPNIDILIGGSPCQGFSFAGKQLNFKDPRSALFFEFVRLLKELKPKYFLLENVRMKQEFQDIISEHLGVKPIAINSNLVSAQNRYRLYWTNIPNIKQPKDKGIFLKDIIHELRGELVDDKYFVKADITLKNRCIQAIKGVDEKARALTATMHKGAQANGMTCIRVGEIGKGGQGDRIYSIDGKSVALSANGGGRGAKTGLYLVTGNARVRKLTPIECERLQTLPEIEPGYTFGISNTQRYKALGNGWTVDVIAHIFKNIKQTFKRD